MMRTRWTTRRGNFLFSGGGGGGGGSSGGSLAFRLLNLGALGTTTKLAGGGGVMEQEMSMVELSETPTSSTKRCWRNKSSSKGARRTPAGRFSKVCRGYEKCRQRGFVGRRAARVHENAREIVQNRETRRRSFNFVGSHRNQLGVERRGKESLRRVRGERETENGRENNDDDGGDSSSDSTAPPQPPPPPKPKIVSTPKIFSDASRDRQKEDWFGRTQIEYKHQTSLLISSVRKKQQKRKPLATIAKPLCATDLSNRSSAATLRVISVSRKAAQKPRKRQTTIKTTR